MIRLKELRQEVQITQKQLAEKLGTSQQVIGYYENGINQPAPDTLIQLADFFQCSIDYLLGRSDDFGNISIQTDGPQLTAEEQQLLNDFRTLPRPERAQATEYVHYLADRRGIKNKHA